MTPYEQLQAIEVERARRRSGGSIRQRVTRDATLDMLPDATLDRLEGQA